MIFPGTETKESNPSSVASMQAVGRQYLFGDIYAYLDEDQGTITLDLRSLPAIKIDAIARLLPVGTEAPYTDLILASARFMRALYARYGTESGTGVIGSVAGVKGDPYLVKIECTSKGVEHVFGVAADLSSYLLETIRVGVFPVRR